MVANASVCACSVHGAGRNYGRRVVVVTQPYTWPVARYWVQVMDTMDLGAEGRKSKKRRKLEKLKKEAKRRRLMAKSKEKENLKEIEMGARLKERSESKSKFREDLQQVNLSERMLGPRDRSEARSARAEVMDGSGGAEMDGRKKKVSKAKPKEKVDLKKLFRVS